ncbi:unnamed protein product [Larinioides sclopetarius]|uniref:Uncharacterized protein n=1 Tax=Larinioides sclopetarius TaxID=280406 RepID=A0AAV2BAP4_9ARAC
MLLRGPMTKLVILSFKRRIPLKVALEVFKTATVIPSLSFHKLESEFISIKIGSNHCSIFRYVWKALKICKIWYFHLLQQQSLIEKNRN